MTFKSILCLSPFRVLLLLWALPFHATTATAVEFLGTYSRIQYTAEHYYLNQLTLWHEGENAFGFYSFHAALQGDPVQDMMPIRISGSLKGNVILLNGEFKQYFIFKGRISKNSLSGQITTYMMNGRDLTLDKLSPSKTEPSILKAYFESHDAWEKWAEIYLDTKEASNKQISDEVALCANGDGQACLGAGNRASHRGKLAKAQSLYESGCNFNNPTSCQFIGRTEKARGILESSCTGKPTMNNNFACRDLGKLEEKAGNLTAAREWYRKGCNKSIPLICPDFNRLNADTESSLPPK